MHTELLNSTTKQWQNWEHAQRDPGETSLTPEGTEQPRCSKGFGVIPQKDVWPFPPRLLSLKCLGTKFLGFSEHQIPRHHLLEWPQQSGLGINIHPQELKGCIEWTEGASKGLRRVEPWAFIHSLDKYSLMCTSDWLCSGQVIMSCDQHFGTEGMDRGPEK